MTNSMKTRKGIQKVGLRRVLRYGFCVLALVVSVCAGCAQKQQPVSLYVDAVVLRDLDQNELAAEKLNAAVKIDDRFWLAYSLLGEIYEDFKDYEESASFYERATELNPLSFKDYFNLGRVYSIMEKFALAVKAYVKACEIDPAHLEAHISAAETYYQLKEYNGALAYGRRAEEIDPNVGEVQKLLGNIYDSQRDYEQAIRSYKRSLEIDSNDVEVMRALAMAYLQTERYEPARQLLTEVLAKEPGDSLYQHLGYCQLRLGEVDGAIESYSGALMIDEKDWQAARGLGVAYMLKSLGMEDEGLKARAVEQWRLSLAIKPDQPRSDKLIALIEKYSK
ncbi:MAG: tetratricopeptide repeat protein [Planctomycetota bacterium]|jgi:superkiller protein 3